jgi:hypothetical protein
MDIGAKESVTQAITETNANIMAVVVPHVKIQVPVTGHPAPLIITVGVALAGADITAQKFEKIVLSRQTSAIMEAAAMITRNLDCVVSAHQVFMEHSASLRLWNLGVAAILTSTIKGRQLVRFQALHKIALKELLILRPLLRLCHMGRTVLDTWGKASRKGSMVT